MKLSRNTELLLLLNKYFKNLEKNEEIIKYLYNHTELFEKEYMIDFPEELFRFVSGKIGTYARQRNKFLTLLDENQLKELKRIEILEL